MSPTSNTCHTLDTCLAESETCCEEYGLTQKPIKDKFHESHALSDSSRPYIFHRGHRSAIAHWHENIEILYFHGGGTVICDRSEYTSNKGDIVIVGSNALHAVLRCEETRYDCLIIDSSFLKKSDIDVSALKFDSLVRDTSAQTLFHAASKAISTANSSAFGAAAAKAAILTLTVHLCSNYSTRDDSGRGHGTTIKRAMGYIKAHYDEVLTVDDIAEQVGLSKYYFCREFRRDTGFTVVQYINNLRCAEAERLLRDDKYSVSEIARMCGFENMSYFTRTYKSLIGCTPTKTRDALDKESQADVDKSQNI